MNMYITCRKRANQPAIHVLVCERKCKDREKCKEYKEYLLNNTPGDNVPSKVGENLL